MSRPTRMIPDDDVDAALAWLRDSAKPLGEAKARTVRAGHMIRHIEALEFKKSNASSAEARKADARTSDAYHEAILEDAIAAGEYEKLKALREAAALKIQAWQSECANVRSMKI